MSSTTVVIIVILFAFTIFYNIVFGDSKSCNTSPGEETEYYIVARSYTSKQNVLANKTNLKTVEDCKKLARTKKGMAFSFKYVSTPLHAKNSRSNKTKKKSKSSCIVYECPEVENSTSLVHSEGYEYYSIFADPIPPENATCISQLGVFVLHKARANYTTAKHRCREYGSTLPDVATEKRTNNLAEMLENLYEKGSLKEAYVGMENMDKTSFVRSNGEPLACSNYRAWAPGHPRTMNKTCVLLTAKKMWKTVDCRVKKPFICEIYPGGWFQVYDFYDYYYFYP